MLSLVPDTAYLITKPENIFYFTNFDGEGFALVSKKSITLATDQRYWLLAQEVKKESVKMFDLKAGWQDELNKIFKKIKVIYFEEDHLTVAGLERWKKILPNKKWLKSGGSVENLRLIKSDEELDKLRMAASMGDEILKKILPELKAGVTEKEIANLFRRYSDELADGISFPPIVAFGANGAIPHHHSGQTKLKLDDAILIDQGVRYQGYMSDMTRCFFVGNGIPAVRKMYHQLLEVQQMAVNMVRAGVVISDLDKAVRAMLGKEEKYFTHSLGHGVGLEVHEEPGVSGRSDVELKPGMVITIEPGLYKPGVGGVRIEDTVIVTGHGCEVITRSTKNVEL